MDPGPLKRRSDLPGAEFETSTRLCLQMASYHGWRTIPPPIGRGSSSTSSDEDSDSDKRRLHTHRANQCLQSVLFSPVIPKQNISKHFESNNSDTPYPRTHERKPLQDHCGSTIGGDSTVVSTNFANYLVIGHLSAIPYCQLLLTGSKLTNFANIVGGTPGSLILSLMLIHGIPWYTNLAKIVVIHCYIPRFTR